MPITLEQLAEYVAQIADRVGSRSFVDVNAIADSLRAALAEQPVDPPTDWKARAEAAEAKLQRALDYARCAEACEDYEGPVRWRWKDMAELLQEEERDAALAEVARMRPVVEAAVEIHNGPEYCDEALLDKYYNALDNYMESTK